jgi:hypothetical protein
VTGGVAARLYEVRQVTERTRRMGRTGRRMWVTGNVLLGELLVATPAFAAGQGGASLGQVIDNARLWVLGLLAAVATLMMVIGGARYVLAAGDPGQVERAKQTMKSALAGYALAVLAPVLLSVLQGIVGG